MEFGSVAMQEMNKNRLESEAFYGDQVGEGPDGLITGMVSVVVPAYNCKEYLKRCADSLTEQFYTNLEILIIDDGSTDGTGELANTLPLEDPRIRVIHKENAGQGLARNDGIDLARGEFIAFVDSDDYIDPRTFQTAVARIQDTGADLCAYGFLQEEEGTGRVVYTSQIKPHTYVGEEVRTRFLLHFFGDDPGDNDLSSVFDCMTLYRTQIMKDHQVRFPSERIVYSEDMIFNLEYCRYIKRAVTIDDLFYRYVIKPDSFTHRYQPDRIDKALAFREILTDYAREYDLENETKQRILWNVWLAVMECFKMEVRRESEVGRSTVMKSISDLVMRDDVYSCIRSMKLSGYNIKQQILILAVRMKLPEVCYLMTRMKVRQGGGR